MPESVFIDPSPEHAREIAQLQREADAEMEEVSAYGHELRSRLRELGGVLRSAREAEGFTLETLSKTTTIPAETLEKMERGRAHVTFERLVRCSQALGRVLSVRMDERGA